MPAQGRTPQTLLARILPNFVKERFGDVEKSEPLFQQLQQDEDPTQPAGESSGHNITKSAFGSSTLLLAIGILTGVIGLLILQWLFGPSQGKAVSNGQPGRPQIPIVTTTFDRDPLFAAPSTEESDVAWGSLMPHGDGFIHVSDSESHGLEPGIQTPQGEIYDVSLFHQLHCLMNIREAFFLTKFAMNSTDTERINKLFLEPQQKHVLHCFDYIRQGIMCAGDLTLEWPRTEHDGRRFAVDGWGVSHQCKSWDAINDYMVQRERPS